MFGQGNLLHIGDVFVYEARNPEHSEGEME